MKFFYLIVLFLFVSCGAELPVSDSPIIAKVGNEFLTLEQAKQHIPSFLYAQDSVFALNTYREQWIKSQVWIQDSQRRGLGNDREVSARLAKAQDDILAQAGKEFILKSSNVDVSDAEIEAFFEKNQRDFLLEEKHVRFLHIRTDELDAALVAKAELRRTDEYEPVVRRYANDKAQTISNAERFWPVSSALTEFDIMRQYVISTNQVGAISPIRRIGEELHFVKILAIKNEGDVADVEWVKSSIEEFLIVEKRRKRLSAYEQNLVLQANANGDIDRYLLPKPNTTVNSDINND